MQSFDQLSNWNTFSQRTTNMIKKTSFFSKNHKFTQPIFQIIFLITTHFLKSRASISPPPIPILPIPTSNQLKWQLTEMAMFFHFGTNTFTDSEWGTGKANPSVFNPTELNATQWVNVAKDSGFSKVILTVKHHDGFCLWPSDYTDYSVKSSSWRNGSGDVVAELAAAAKIGGGVQLGVYLSPWDRHEPCYGKTVEYNEFYLGQMNELLTRYGEIDEIWLDGAKGEGEKDMEYFFDNWFSVIRQLQPGAAIFSDTGPDTRWVGNEAGHAGTTCWSNFNRSATYIGDPNFTGVGSPSGPDWVPPECDVSIRSGWFWHASQSPKSALELLDLYYKTVGRNCLLLLNVPPNSSGLISTQDIKVLQDFATIRDTIFSYNLGKNALVSASSTRGSNYAPRNILEEGINFYWAPGRLASNWTLYLEFRENVTFNVLMVQEPIQMGQRIMEFRLDFVNAAGEWEEATGGTTVGYKRLLLFPSVRAGKLRLVIGESRAEPLVGYLGLYLDPFSIMGSVPMISSRAVSYGSESV